MSAVAPHPEATTISITLTQQEQEILGRLAAERNLPAEVVMREALLEKWFFASHRRAGEKVVFQHPDGKLSPINWAY